MPSLRVARSRKTKITMNSELAPNFCHCPPHTGRLSQGSRLLQQQPLAPTQQQAILHGGVGNPLPSPLSCPSCVPLELPNPPSTVISDVHDLTLIQLPPPPSNGWWKPLPSALWSQSAMNLPSAPNPWPRHQWPCWALAPLLVFPKQSFRSSSIFVPGSAWLCLVWSANSIHTEYKSFSVWWGEPSTQYVLNLV